MHSIRSTGPNRSPRPLWQLTAGGMVLSVVVQIAFAGCALMPKRDAAVTPCSASSDCVASHLKIESPALCDQSCNDTSQLTAGPPPTLRNYEQLEPWNLTLEEVVQMTLTNAQVLNKLGGVVVSAPQSTGTVFDPGVLATNPLTSSEAALSAFDAQYSSSITHGHSEQAFNNSFFGGGANTLNTYTGQYLSRLSKTTATGAQFNVSTQIDYNRNNSPFNRFASVWTINTLAEVRAPLLRNGGTMVNRIAGPNAIPGNYNGVLIGRIREDISLAGFEANVRDLVRDTVTTYWELYFAYQDLETKIVARDASREVWMKRKTLVEGGDARAAEEAQARQQYFSFQTQVETALMGAGGRSGVYGTERQLRRLMGLPTADGRLIRPATEPTVAEVLFDWNASQMAAMEERVELRRQKWVVRQRELELCAAKNLEKWRVDLVANYGSAGLGDKLWGNSSIPFDGAIQELFGGELDNWRFGFEVQRPVGNRLAHLGVRNAQLGLVRDKALLLEQQRQILHDLGASYAEVDRTFALIKGVYNNRIAVQEELKWRQFLVDFGEDNSFFLLETRQRATAIDSTLHRAIADYNIALMTFAYNEGRLLEQFNIVLDEGPSSAPAQAAAANNSGRMAPARGLPAVHTGILAAEPTSPAHWNRPAADATHHDAKVPAPVEVDPSGHLVIELPELK